jgi:hypothetical protein
LAGNERSPLIGRIGNAHFEYCGPGNRADLCPD